MKCYLIGLDRGAFTYSLRDVFWQPEDKQYDWCARLVQDLEKGGECLSKIFPVEMEQPV